MKLLITTISLMLLSAGCAPVGTADSPEVCKKYTLYFSQGDYRKYYKVDEIVKDDGYYYVASDDVRYPYHSLFAIQKNKCEGGHE